MSTLLLALYGLFAFVALLNLLLMRRPRPVEPVRRLAVLIPARNEADNLKVLLPQLVGEGRDVFVFDDESDDGTGAVARSLGATVVEPSEALPAGWTGKNRAVHQLALAAAEASPAEWIMFLDADVRVHPGFFGALESLIRDCGGRTPVITAFPRVLPGQGIEPLFLAWVGWSLLASNPFGLVDRSRLGHNRFLNGQFQLWRASKYLEVLPNERLKDRVMEDVAAGRLLAREGVPVTTANLSKYLDVRMYETWRQTLDGMSKNSFEITGSAWGSVLVAGLFLLGAWGWLLASPGWLGLGLLTFSGLCVTRLARTVVWPALLMPIALTIAAFTVLRSLWWRKTGQTRWKGRVYP